MEQIAYAGDVHHRIQCPHLMEMDLPYPNTVGLGLRLRDQAIGFLGALPHCLGQWECVNHCKNL